VAAANLFTKKIATIYGLSFTLALFAVFWYSARRNAARRAAEGPAQEEFNLEIRPGVDPEALQVKAGCVAVAVRDYTRMEHLKKVLRSSRDAKAGIVVMTIRPVSPPGAGEHELSEKQMFGAYERELFSHVVAAAEAEGRTVSLLAAPATDPFYAMVAAANQLRASRLVTGVSPVMPPQELARRIGNAWERLPAPRHSFALEVAGAEGAPLTVILGPHAPRLSEEELQLLHELWLRLSQEAGQPGAIHHADVAALALRRLARDLEAGKAHEILQELRRRPGRA
jgi:hypothetical protein